MRFVALPPTLLGALAGPFYTPAAGQEALPFYGTDLGVSFTHGDEIRILFGDTWLDEFGTPLTVSHDDCQGALSLTDFPDGDAVDAFLNALPASTRVCCDRARARKRFDAFTEVREDGQAVDVYWNVSTWNPYQVMFLRTRLRKEH